MSIEIPTIVRAEDITDWDDEVDVLVIGFGIAGGSAAVEAAASGARVLVLDRGTLASCTSAMAGGHFYLGGGTPVQQATGHADSPEEMFKYLEAVSPDPDREKIRLYCDGSVELFGWLEGLGFEFERSYFPGKAVIQPGTEGLMFTGNEKVWPYRDLAVPAPRGHKVPHPGPRDGGGLVINLLDQRARQLGVDLRFESAAEALVRDETGQICGVRWSQGGHIGHIRAGSVVIAAGGFINNDAMLAEHAPHLIPMVHQGNPHDDGLGIRLGLSAGGTTRHMSGAFTSSPFYPPGEMLTAIMVNKDGERFIAEDGYHSRSGGAVLEQPDRTAYLIADTQLVAEAPHFGLSPQLGTWDDLAAIERELQIPAKNLQETVASYNEHAAEGRDLQFHKHPDWVRPLSGPWVVYDLSFGKATFLSFTLGGLTTSVDAEVLDAAGTPIPGLYAVGASASNIAQDSAGYSSGTAMGEGAFFGRRAGRHATTTKN